ncbi:hypothetical protein [Flavobacterium aquatile]|uniref:Uncharacterized protein n=1 Tax=Flavobacterium aquatile LMG 4008 = ATCC 11947 TaxID=1453498 RepID=A0A095U0U5_9FLAO|nr:hypothetical protein [Flavobacterium aquatile]KGD68243.1 hypothetical protein LG45_08095 [Flavobacterium aquatile LMG 4008 = ATCC 11947]OXA68822.1 hypothetical protein B0A61_03705 [Flavobacterium aquatile LMG 4008 = ATCC 11947]GEC77282.1 hypothetical protein FAQ01_01520 [Flavobacterium aquatile]
MKANSIKISNLKSTLFLLILLVTQLSFSQKNTQTATINKGIKVLPNTNSTCDCNSIDFKIRIIKLNSIKPKRTYKLQLIDFENKKNCPIKFFSLNWIGHRLVPMTSMRKQNFEKADDGSVYLYEFEFDTNSTAIEPEDETETKATILVKIGDKTCFLKDKTAIYYKKM